MSQNSSIMSNALNNAKVKYKNRHEQLQDIHKNAMNELKRYMYEETEEKVMFKRYEKIDDVYTYEFHLYPQKKEDLKIIYDYCLEVLNWIKKICEASNAGKWVEIINDEYVALYFRYKNDDARQTDKNYDKKHEIDISGWTANSFFSSTMNVDYDKLKSLIWKEIKIYDESCEAYPKKVIIEKVDEKNWLVHFSKEIMLGWYSFNYSAFGSKLIEAKLLLTTKLYDENYQPNYKLPEESDEFSAF